MNCPECESVLTDEQKKCRCGWRVTSALGTSARHTIEECGYQTGAHQCTLPGTSSGGRDQNKFCLWHFRTLDNPQNARNLHAFMEFKEEMKGDLYSKSVWDWPLEKLWPMLTGQQVKP